MKIYNILKANKLIPAPGVLLDLGSGDGKQSIPFLEAGWKATLVDMNGLAFESSPLKGNPSAECIVSEIPAFLDATKARYDLVIANNILAFFEKPEEIIGKFSLRTGGVLWVSFFGPQDARNGVKKNMFFLTKEKALSYLQADYDINVFMETLGMGPTMKGELKFTHKFEIVAIKK